MTDLGQARTSHADHYGDMKEVLKDGEAYPDVVQQLMFNRVLASVRLLWVDHVTVTAFDVKTGTIEGVLGGVNFVVSVRVVPNA